MIVDASRCRCRCVARRRGVPGRRRTAARRPRRGRGRAARDRGDRRRARARVGDEVDARDAVHASCRSASIRPRFVKKKTSVPSGTNVPAGSTRIAVTTDTPAVRDHERRVRDEGHARARRRRQRHRLAGRHRRDRAARPAAPRRAPASVSFDIAVLRAAPVTAPPPAGPGAGGAGRSVLPPRPTASDSTTIGPDPAFRPFIVTATTAPEPVAPAARGEADPRPAGLDRPLGRHRRCRRASAASPPPRPSPRRAPGPRPASPRPTARPSPRPARGPGRPSGRRAAPPPAG